MQIRKHTAKAAQKQTLPVWFMIAKSVAVMRTIPDMVPVCGEQN